MFTSISTANGRFRVENTGYTEPNNGRELWQVTAWLNHTDITSLLFSNAWACLNFNLQNWILEDPATGWCYVPAEGRAILFHPDTRQVQQLPAIHLSTIVFQGNSFQEGWLFENYGDHTRKTRLTEPG